jgi:hypothetical protein
MVERYHKKGTRENEKDIRIVQIEYNGQKTGERKIVLRIRRQK